MVLVGLSQVQMVREAVKLVRMAPRPVKLVRMLRLQKAPLARLGLLMPQSGVLMNARLSSGAKFSAPRQSKTRLHAIVGTMSGACCGGVGRRLKATKAETKTSRSQNASCLGVVVAGWALTSVQAVQIKSTGSSKSSLRCLACFPTPVICLGAREVVAPWAATGIVLAS